MRTEHLILNNLLNDEDYARRTLPYLKTEYFNDTNERIIYQELDHFITEYNALPSREALNIQINNRSNINDKQFSEITEYVNTLSGEQKDDKDWLIEMTEKFCQEKAIYNAIMDSIQIIDGEGNRDKGAIPELLSDALAVSFDPNVGHDWSDNSGDRFDFYHRVEERIPFDIEYLNKITKGGVPKKSLNIILAGTGVGKSLAMCHMASANLLEGKNVLYITMEMAEEKIAERIDANLLNVRLDELKELPRDSFEKKINRVRNKTTGKLIVKEYPTAAANVGHFRHLINELRLKKSFKPDIIYVDYLNICASARMKVGGSINTYTYIKSIAEELRGLAVEQNLPIWSATQTTRSGYTNSDVGLEDTSESFGLPATADFMMAIISTEELEQLNQVLVKQLKNRYGDPNSNKRFVVGIDRAKMRLYDAEESAQDDLIQIDQTDTGPINSFGNRERKDKFSNIKV
jgi:replicative DNA helicase